MRGDPVRASARRRRRFGRPGPTAVGTYSALAVADNLPPLFLPRENGDDEIDLPSVRIAIAADMDSIGALEVRLPRPATLPHHSFPPGALWEREDRGVFAPAGCRVRGRPDQRGGRHAEPHDGTRN